MQPSPDLSVGERGWGSLDSLSSQSLLSIYFPQFNQLKARIQGARGGATHGSGFWGTEWWGEGRSVDLAGKGELPSAEDTAVIQVGLMPAGTEVLGMDGSGWIQECLRGPGGPRVRRMC